MLGFYLELRSGANNDVCTTSAVLTFQSFSDPGFVFIHLPIHSAGQGVKRPSVPLRTGHMILHKSTE